MKKVLFIDRDGTLVIEPPIDFQLDSLKKLEYYPGVFYNLRRIAFELDYELVMVTNQDGLGTSSFPSETFWPAQEKMVGAFKNEGIQFAAIHIDPSLPGENSPNRKPKTGMLQTYLNSNYDIENSFVIGDRLSDMQLAENLGCQGIYINQTKENQPTSAALCTCDWSDIYSFLANKNRSAKLKRKTNETDINIRLNLNGSGLSNIDTGIAFFDHMLCQISKHALVDLEIKVIGDLKVDEHHTIEDTAIALGEIFRKALGSKIGIERYGYLLPMDDCLAQVAIDFGGRNWLVWEAEFKREMIGKMPSEMFFHFFKSFTDGALCNLNIKAEGTNEHHKIESIFKAFAKAIKMAIQQDPDRMILPTTKGLL